MKIGFFGGAFDPFHIEHKQILKSAIDELKLDKVVVYPSCNPPHKKCVTPFEYRLLLTKTELSDMEQITVDDIENNGLLNPTCETIPILKKKYPSDNYYFIMGGDSILNFSKWIKPEKIVKEVTLVVVARENTAETQNAIREVEKQYGAKIIILNYVGKEVSSSLIRADVSFGNKPNGISDDSYKIIKEKGLYFEYVHLVEKLRNNIPEKTFEHSKRTVYYALKLNTKLGVSFDKIFKSALLHDCAKHIHKEMDGVPSAVVHQFLGAEYAKKEYLICDKDILEAIEFHTTGKPEMTMLGKIVFCADMLESGRSYESVERLREIIENDFEKGFVECVNASFKKLTEDNKPFHPLTKACAEYYNKINK